jgi:hypothetical protein
MCGLQVKLRRAKAKAEKSGVNGDAELTLIGGWRASRCGARRIAARHDPPKQDISSLKFHHLRLDLWR